MKPIIIAVGEACALMLALLVCSCTNEIEVPADLPGSIEERPDLVPSVSDTVPSDTATVAPPAAVDPDAVFAAGNADGVVLYYRPLSAETCEVVSAAEGAVAGAVYQGRIVIPSQVTREGRRLTVVAVAERAFERSGVTEVILPATLTRIGAYAFQYSTALRSLVIPGGVTRVETCLCRGCSSLTSVTLGNGIDCIGKLAFTKCAALSEVNLPGSLGVIDVGAFQSCPSLTSIVIPRYVSTINDYAFSRCGLTSFAFADRVQVVAEGVLQDCLTLTSVTLPASLTTIGSYAFAGCAALGQVELPASLGRIGSHAFAYCHALGSVRALPPSPPACSEDSFEAAPSGGIAIRLEVPAGQEAAYGAASVWSRFAQIVSGVGQ